MRDPSEAMNYTFCHQMVSDKSIRIETLACVNHLSEIAFSNIDRPRIKLNFQAIVYSCL